MMSSPSAIPTRRILVVDDNPAIHEDFRKILCPVEAETESSLNSVEATLFEEAVPGPAGAKFIVDSAFQGQEALVKVRTAADLGQPYSLAFIDVRMPPGWDGIETITQIWKEFPATQMVICTAYSDYTWQQVFRELGETDNLVILKKPFDNLEVMQLAYALTKKWLLNLQAAEKMDRLDRLVAERTVELETANHKLSKEILERTQAEEALRLSEERFLKAFNASPVAMAICTLRSEYYLDANEAYLRMLGCSRDQVLGRAHETLNIYVNRQQREEVLARIREGKSLRDYRAQIASRSGQAREVLISGERIELQIEPCILFLFQDVTDRLALENQLRQSQKMETVGQLAAGLAHDFNNLLTVIQGHVAMHLPTPQPGHELAASLKEIGDSADRAAQLTRQLLAFSRKEAIQRRAVNLNPLLQQLTSMLQRLLGESIKLVYQCADALPNILADSGSLEQIIVNLAVNARDAMPRGGELTVSTACVEVDANWCQRNPEARPGRFVRFRVADTGCGMEASILSHIFEPFFTTKEVGQGSGLGLSTVHGITRQHEGWIEVASQPGRGSVFNVFFPVTDEAVPTPEAPLAAPPPTHCSEVILLAEDEPYLRQLTCKILTRNGYRVLTAEGGTQALAIWKEQMGKIDLLLTDIIMPGGISGTQLAQQLLEQKPGLKVVYTSGYSHEIAGTSFAQDHLTTFLQKPFKPSALLQIVRNCLDAPAATP